MHLIFYYPHYFCLCTVWSYHLYFLLQFIQLVLILVTHNLNTGTLAT